MQRDHDLDDYDDETLRFFAALPREAPLDPRGADRLVDQLRSEGFFQSRRPWFRWALQAAAAIVIFVLGSLAGARYARHNSLEEMLAKKNLSVADRVLLLQRAGSAYVLAADSYAAATARIDSGAVEVATHVLIGAAHAVARSSLDAGLSKRLSSAIQSSTVIPVSQPHKPVIWF